MRAEPTSAKVVERCVVEKFDGDPPTPEHPKEPVEVVICERRSDDSSTTIRLTKKE